MPLFYYVLKASKSESIPVEHNKSGSALGCSSPSLSIVQQGELHRNADRLQCPISVDHNRCWSLPQQPSGLIQTIVKEQCYSAIVLCILTRSPCVVTLNGLEPLLDVRSQHGKGLAVGVAFISRKRPQRWSVIRDFMLHNPLLTFFAAPTPFVCISIGYTGFKQRHPTALTDRHP